MFDDDPGGMVGAIIARDAAQTLRLSVCYAAAHQCDVITSDHLRAAYAAWRYCRDSAAYIFGDTLGDRVLDGLLAAITDAGPEGLDGTAQSAVFGRHESAARLEAARRELEGMKLITTITEQTGGRPRIVSYIR